MYNLKKDRSRTILELLSEKVCIRGLQQQLDKTMEGGIIYYY